MQNTSSPFFTDEYEVIQQALWEFQNSLFICSVAKVTKVTEKTVSIQPLVNYFDKTLGFKQIPELDEVPVLQIWTKTASITIPIVVDDTGIVIWFDRDIEEALKTGVPAKPSSGNLNNVQACVFIPFLSSLAPNILKAEDGLVIDSKTKLTATVEKELSVSSKDTIKIESEKTLAINAKNAITLKSDQKVTATGTAGMDIQGGGISLPDTLKQMAQDAQNFAQALSGLTSGPLAPIGAAASSWLPTLVAAVTKLQTFKG